MRHLQIYRDKTDAPHPSPPPSPPNAVRSVGAAGDGRGEINYLGHPKWGKIKDLVELEGLEGFCDVI